MRKVLTDLVQIKRLGDQKRSENERFRQHMKRTSFPDRRLRQAAESIQEQIDCTTCANCCRVALTPITERDVARISRFLRLTPAQFTAKYCVEDPEDGLVLKRTENGCVFLEGNLCSIYEERPHNCENFPHLVRGEGSLASRMWQMIDRATYCPIAYNSLEEFKVMTKFRR